MKVIVGIFNGYDVDDYYIVADSKEHALIKARSLADYIGGWIESLEVVPE